MAQADGPNSPSEWIGRNERNTGKQARGRPARQMCGRERRTRACTAVAMAAEGRGRGRAAGGRRPSKADTAEPCRAPPRKAPSTQRTECQPPAVPHPARAPAIWAPRGAGLKARRPPPAGLATWLLPLRGADRLRKREDGGPSLCPCPCPSALGVTPMFDIDKPQQH